MMKDAPVKKKHATGLPGGPAPKLGDGPPVSAAHNSIKRTESEALTKLREIMWRLVGVLRSGKELTHAIEQLQSLALPTADKPGQAQYELRNMRELALLVARSALARQESRGSHYRADFPYRDDEGFGKHSLAQKGKEIRFCD